MAFICVKDLIWRVPTGPWRDDNVIITSKRCCAVILHNNDVIVIPFVRTGMISNQEWFHLHPPTSNPLKPAVKSGMKILLEQHQLGMLQLRLSDHQLYRLLRWVLHWRFGDILYHIYFQTSMNVTRHLARMELLATTLNHPGLTAVTVCLVITAPTVKLVSKLASLVDKVP